MKKRNYSDPAVVDARLMAIARLRSENGVCNTYGRVLETIIDEVSREDGGFGLDLRFDDEEEERRRLRRIAKTRIDSLRASGHLRVWMHGGKRRVALTDKAWARLGVGAKGVPA